MVELFRLASGAVIGLSVAAPVGPMAIMCINRTLRSGFKAGVSTGAGASTVHAAYASVVLLGLQQVRPFLASHHPAMSLVSAGLMLLFAWRILHPRTGRDSGSDTGSALRNYISAVTFSCLNPMLLVLLVGAVGIVIGPKPPVGPALPIVPVGVFLGSVGWWIFLSAATSTLRGRFSTAVIDRAAAAGMIGFAALPLAQIMGGS